MRSHFSLPGFLLLVLTLSACNHAPAAAAASEGLLPVGSMAPEVEGTTEQGSTLKLSQAKGTIAVVYFYPKDETPGCTKEACAFRDNYSAFESAGVTVFGVSRDSAQSHAAFRAHYQLPFVMVADGSGSVQQAYRVPSKLPGIAARVTFLIDRKGKIAHVWPDVDPVQHAKEVLAVAHQLPAS
jgi:peroxiredoxin Q/BCP